MLKSKLYHFTFVCGIFSTIYTRWLSLDIIQVWKYKIHIVKAVMNSILAFDIRHQLTDRKPCLLLLYEFNEYKKCFLFLSLFYFSHSCASSALTTNYQVSSVLHIITSTLIRVTICTVFSQPQIYWSRFLKEPYFTIFTFKSSLKQWGLACGRCATKMLICYHDWNNKWSKEWKSFFFDKWKFYCLKWKFAQV